VVYKKTFDTAGTAQEQMLYLHRDYQGSILAITNDAGAIVEKRQFDPWGAIIKVQDGNGNALAGLTILDRGYTGHEHLQSVGLINMNGRLYDPKLHRFLQPDNYVQDASNTQNYNRYSYVLNNPLKYTDPSGERWKITWSDVASGLAIVGGAVLCFIPGGAVVGVPLIAAGVNHFLQTIKEYNQTGDWTSASNNAGFIVSYTHETDFGYNNKDKKNGITQSAPVVTPKTVDDVKKDKGENVFGNSMINSMENFYNYNHVGLRNLFGEAEIVGGTMEMVGGVTAIFSEGAGLSLAADGAKLSLFGTVGNVIMDGLDGEWGSAFTRSAEFGVSFGMGNAIKSGVPQKTIRNSFNAFQAYFETYVMPYFKDSWNKFNTPRTPKTPRG
jgi:RHS repeat-associated protein